MFSGVFASALLIFALLLVFSSTVKADSSCSVGGVCDSSEPVCGLSVLAALDKDSYSAGENVVLTGGILDNGSAVSGNYVVLVRDSVTGSVVLQRQSATATGAFVEQFGSTQFAEGNYDVVVQAVSGRCAAPQALLQFRVGCDISASVAQLPDCFGNAAQFYVVRVDNALSSNNTVQVSYSSPLQLAGPSSVSLAAGEGRLFNFTVNAPGDLTGDTIGLVNVVGQNALCTKKLTVPICVLGKISLEVRQDDAVQAIPGIDSCVPVVLRNRGPDTAIVSLSGTRVSGDASYNVSGYFNFPKVKLSAYEIRDDLRFCASVPSGASGNYSFDLLAQNAVGDVHATARFNAIGGGISTSAPSGCMAVDSNSQLPVTFTNNLPSGDYYVSFDDPDGLGVYSSPSVISDFQQGSSRTVYLSFSPVQAASPYAHYATMMVNKGGQQLLQQSLCFFVSQSGNNPAGQPGAQMFSHSVFPQSVSASCNYNSTATLRVRNTAGYFAAYSLSAASAAGYDVWVSPSALSIAPNYEGTATVTIRPKAGASAGARQVPITIQYQPDYSTGRASIDCGEGSSASATGCAGAGGSCNAYCYYSGVSGVKTVRGSVRGVSCQPAQVAVGPVSSCALSASPDSLSSGGTSVISIDYKNLAYSPGTITVSCGNGNTAAASGCTGTSGSCVATCTYQNNGVYTTSASASGYSCAPAQVAVGSTAPWCSLVPSSDSLGGSGSVSVGVHYQNIPDSVQYQQSAYSDTETVSVNLPSTCTTGFAATLTYVSATPTPTPVPSSSATLSIANATPTPVPQNAGNASQLEASLVKASYAYPLVGGDLSASFDFAASRPANATGGASLVTAHVGGLPSDWNVSILPAASVEIAPGANASFSVQVSAKNFSNRDYNASFELSDSKGGVKTVPFTVRAGAGVDGVLSGLFVLGAEANQNPELVFAVLLLGVGGFLVYKAGKNLEKAKSA